MADQSNTNSQAPLVEELVVTPVIKKRFNINEFFAEVRNDQILTNNKFLVQFQPFYATSKVTEKLKQFQLEDGETLTLRCEAASLPGPKFLTNNNIRRYGYGPVEHVVHDVQFSNISLTWIVDANAKLIEFFDAWTNIIVNYRSQGGSDMRTTVLYPGDVEYEPYNVGYKDDYACSRITIFVYNQELKQAVEYNLYDAFPVSISDVALDWGGKSSHLRYTVTFAFTDIRVKRNTESYLSFDDYVRELGISNIKNALLGGLIQTGKSIVEDGINKGKNVLINGITKVFKGN